SDVCSSDLGIKITQSTVYDQLFQSLHFHLILNYEHDIHERCGCAGANNTIAKHSVFIDAQVGKYIIVVIGDVVIEVFGLRQIRYGRGGTGTSYQTGSACSGK